MSLPNIHIMFVLLQQEWLPVGLRSWSPVRLIYSVSHYSWASKGFPYTADYKFITDSYCGHHTTTQHSGKKYTIRTILSANLFLNLIIKLNLFQCTKVLLRKVFL